MEIKFFIIIKNSIKFIDVDFSYNVNEKVLEKLNLTITKKFFDCIGWCFWIREINYFDLLIGLQAPDNGKIMIERKS